MSARSMAKWLLGLAGLGLLCGCSEAEVVAELRSLQGSEDAVFVCRDASGVGHPFSECPDRDYSDNADASKDLSIMALVSQTVTNEVAVVNVSSGHVVDVDPSTPGFGFLRVGGRPVAMASSPGGAATFVATADVGRNGIFVLPTSCLDAPAKEEKARDLTQWPACRLNSAPAEIAVLVEPPSDGEVFTSCAGGELQTEQPAGAGGACPANLETESGPQGRRKLLVSLPDRGELVVIDAQAVADTEPGAFPPCVIEKRLSLDVQESAAVQRLPPDLESTCSDDPVPTAPPATRRAPQPAGFAVGEDKVYIADEAAPVIHIIDTSSVCNINELPPLLPRSLREPERVVTTRRVALSPLTPSGKRYVYAIDAEDQPGASVMAFDVSPGSTDPTPIVRPGSPELSGERPDRLALGSAAQDVTFAYRDLPYVDPATGTGEFGKLCDPDPSAPADSPGALARSSSDFRSGARPGLLRGLFGFIMLHNGTVAIVDVEDFDAPCRRPISANSSSVADYRGCFGDVPASFSDGDGNRTVTGEVSCRVIQPHRFRGFNLSLNDPEVGVHAPALRGFPQLTLPSNAPEAKPENRPRLLAVPYVGVNGEAVPSDVFVGSTRYSMEEEASDPLPNDPNDRSSDQAQVLNSVVLPPLEPRAYAAEDTATLTYEGAYAGERGSGFLKPSVGRFEDSSLSFCAAGVYDRAAMTDYATKELGLSGEDATRFGESHADYIQITSPLLKREDAWWDQPGHSYDTCLEVFGPHDADLLSRGRDFRIAQAFADHLQLVDDLDGRLELAPICFPTVNKYRLRAQNHWVLTHTNGFNHDIVAAGSDSACVRSCSRLKLWAKSRAFEISSTTCDSAETPADPFNLRVGCAKDGEVACVYEQPPAPPPPEGGQVVRGESAAVQIGGKASECIFDGLTERFAIYRGREDSVRDAAFTWQTTGGFVPLTMSLTNLSPAVSPQSMQFLPSPELMAVVDGSSLGLTLLSLDTFGVVKPSPFY